MSDLLDMFNNLEDTEPLSRKQILKAPFGYPGGKSRLVQKIVDLLPRTDRYVEVFGGSAAVLLSKPKSRLEVYNDKYGGVTDFYRCLQSDKTYQALIARLQDTIHSREEWQHCKEMWCDTTDTVERAAKWYYMLRYSFAGKGGAFGRSLDPNSILSGKVRSNLELFPLIHERLRNVQIENRDWTDCISDYAHPNTVFYLDPPYLEVSDETYKPMGGPVGFTVDSHRQMLDTIFNTEGFFAVSGYENALYEGYDWDGVHEWDVFVSMTGITDQRVAERGTRKEILYILEH